MIKPRYYYLKGRNREIKKDLHIVIRGRMTRNYIMNLFENDYNIYAVERIVLEDYVFDIHGKKYKYSLDGKKVDRLYIYDFIKWNNDIQLPVVLYKDSKYFCQIKDL